MFSLTCKELYSITLSQTLWKNRCELLFNSLRYYSPELRKRQTKLQQFLKDFNHSAAAKSCVDNTNLFDQNKFLISTRRKSFRIMLKKYESLHPKGGYHLDMKFVYFGFLKQNERQKATMDVLDLFKSAQGLCEARFDFRDEGESSKTATKFEFRTGAYLLYIVDSNGWWKACNLKGQHGYLPSTYVQENLLLF